MIDENYNTWLLEINSSPSMEYSTVNSIIFIIYSINFIFYSILINYLIIIIIDSIIIIIY